MSKARPKLDPKFFDYGRTEWEKVIQEYIFDEDDRYIATRYYLDNVSQTTIAEELSPDKPKSPTYMKNHIKRIVKILERNLR